MQHRNFHSKTLFIGLALLSLLLFGVWSAGAQDGDPLPLPNSPAQTENSSTDAAPRITLGGLLGDVPVAASDGQVTLPDSRAMSRLFAQSQQIVPPVFAGEQAFGIDLARDGDVMVVGAPLRDTNTGAAIIYQQNASGAWVSPLILSASDGASGDQFGTNVAMYGDTIFVGAPGASGADTDASEGAVYVFQRDIGGNWVQTQKLQPVLAADSFFGAMIKIDPSGNQLVIGSSTEGVGAFIYRLESGLWQYEAQLAVTGSTVGLHLDGNRALVSSFTFTTPGAVVVFEKSAGAWTQTASFVPTDGHNVDRFGGRISYANSQFFVLGDLDNAGAVYVFEEVGGVWTQRQKLTPSDGAVNDGFGISISPDGETMAIGSALDDGVLGSVYIFKWNGSAWVQDDKIPPVGGAFGIDVILSGHELIVGAYIADTSIGKVYSYTDPDLVPTATPPPTETPRPSVELLTDGGFENNALGWEVKNGTGDKVKCNKTGKTFAHEGACAWRFKGEAGENAKIQQTFTVHVDGGDTLTLSGYVNASGAVDGKVKVVVKYLNAAIPKNKITVVVASETGGVYVPLSTFQPILTTSVVAPIEKIKVMVKNQGESGKVYYDALSLTAP